MLQKSVVLSEPPTQEWLSSLIPEQEILVGFQRQDHKG